MSEYSYNDWRSYLEHKADPGKSKYDWSTGTNPPDYNHDYWEKHKEEIMAQRKKHKAESGESDDSESGVRDFGGNGVGYKAKTDDGKSYENDDDWSDELTDEEKKNIDAHNAQVEKNISELEKTVNDYITANKDKLSKEQIDKLTKDLKTQTEIAREQMISTKNSDDYDYIMGLRKKNGGSGSAPATKVNSKNTSKQSNSKSNSNSSSTSNNKTSETPKSSGKDNTPKGSEAAKSVSSGQQRKEQRAATRYNKAVDEGETQVRSRYAPDADELEKLLSKNSRR